MGHRYKKVIFNTKVLDRGLDIKTFIAIFECLPADSEIKGFGNDYSKMCSYFIVKSKEFDEVETGCQIPDLTIIVNYDNGYTSCEIKKDN